MNKYSPLTFLGLLMIPMVFVVVHAQDNSASGVNDPFEIMLNQAREQQQQKILQDFAKSKKEYEVQNSEIDRERLSKQQKQDRENNDKSNNQPASNITNAPNTPFASAPLPPNIPMPSTNSTNSNAPPSPPINIYIPPPPPPGANPPQRGQAQSSSSMGQNAAPPSKTGTNIYG